MTEPETTDTEEDDAEDIFLEYSPVDYTYQVEEDDDGTIIYAILDFGDNQYHCHIVKIDS